MAGAEEAHFHSESGGQAHILQIQFGGQASHGYGGDAGPGVVRSSGQRYDQIGARGRHELRVRREGSVDSGGGVQNFRERTSTYVTVNVSRSHAKRSYRDEIFLRSAIYLSCSIFFCCRYVYNQIISVLTQSQLNRVYDQRRNFDLRRLLSGSERLIDHLLNFMDREPAFFLGAIKCLPLLPSMRSSITQTIIQTCAKIKVLQGRSESLRICAFLFFN